MHQPTEQPAERHRGRPSARSVRDVLGPRRPRPSAVRLLRPLPVLAGLAALGLVAGVYTLAAGAMVGSTPAGDDLTTGALATATVTPAMPVRAATGGPTPTTPTTPTTATTTVATTAASSPALSAAGDDASGPVPTGAAATAPVAPAAPAPPAAAAGVIVPTAPAAQSALVATAPTVDDNGGDRADDRGEDHGDDHD